MRLGEIENKRIKGVTDTLLMQELSLRIEKADKLIKRLRGEKQSNETTLKVDSLNCEDYVARKGGIQEDQPVSIEHIQVLR